MARIAICGIGNIGTVHLHNLRSMRGCEVAGIFDAHGSAWKDLAVSCGVRVYGSIAELLSDRSVDALVIATPSDSHRALTEEALAAGKHVFVEKPLAGTLEDARAMIEAAAKCPGQGVQAGLCDRFTPQFREARRAVQNQSLGRLRAIHSSRVAPFAMGNPSWELGALDTAVHN